MESKEYEEFVEKFKIKKTTDDCYTPPAVYDAVLNYVKDKHDIEGMEVVRPFYPGGDYENFHYPENCIVIDNPPFSIISKIIRFYSEKGIKYFLFAPHLTLFINARQDYTAIVIDSTIEYENKAKVKTSFVSNLYTKERVIGCTDLQKRIKEAQENNKAELQKYCYPPEVLTVSMVSQIVARGIDYVVNKEDVKFCRGLESQKPHKKGTLS